MNTKYESICFFLLSGRTFTFRNVTLMVDNETAVVFEYKAMSDGLVKTGTFYKSNIAGYSVLE